MNEEQLVLLATAKERVVFDGAVAGWTLRVVSAENGERPHRPLQESVARRSRSPRTSQRIDPIEGDLNEQQ